MTIGLRSVGKSVFKLQRYILFGLAFLLYGVKIIWEEIESSLHLTPFYSSNLKKAIHQ
ncbi:hypothetical protein J7E26_03840 [Bacillus sp. ISL-51]|nr:hypothetical protein [Bacillus sp. ISL-51]